ncbi:uncharacterized protein C19orf85 homolog [Gastrophryne carolinensis]
MHHRSAQLSINLLSRPELGYYECGRDLFTFVTVASSHIMRTLQKPKKSRPTKRKVNHRRFLQNQICRKYSIIEAATHQLANSIFSQEAPVEKQPSTKTINSTAKSNSTEMGKDSISSLQNVLNLSSNLPQLPDMCLGDSAFLGVAEAYLVPDALTKVGVSMDTLTCVSDEVGTVESLFDDIINEDDIFASSYGLVRSRTQLLQHDLEDHGLENHLQTGLFIFNNHISSWLPESISKTDHQLPLTEATHSSKEHKKRSSHGFLFDKQSNIQIGHPYDNRLDSRKECSWAGIETEADYPCGQHLILEQSIPQPKHSTSTMASPFESIIINEAGKPISGPHYENAGIDLSAFCSDSIDPEVYQPLCLQFQDNENCMCSSY